MPSSVLTVHVSTALSLFPHPVRLAAARAEPGRDLPGRKSTVNLGIVTSQNTPAPTNAAEPHDASEQTRIRMEKRAKLIERGDEAYPVGVERTHSLTEIRDKYAHLEADDTTGETVGVTGRIVFIRNTGKLCFATLQ